MIELLVEECEKIKKPPTINSPRFTDTEKAYVRLKPDKSIRLVKEKGVNRRM